MNAPLACTVSRISPAMAQSEAALRAATRKVMTNAFIEVLQVRRGFWLLWSRVIACHPRRELPGRAGRFKLFPGPRNAAGQRQPSVE